MPVITQKRTCKTFGMNSNKTEKISFQAANIVLNTSPNADMGKEYYLIRTELARW